MSLLTPVSYPLIEQHRDNRFVPLLEPQELILKVLAVVVQVNDP